MKLALILPGNSQGEFYSSYDFTKYELLCSALNNSCDEYPLSFSEYFTLGID